MYYLLYADDCAIPLKVAIDPEEPSLGRIRADSVTPPHSLASIKRCFSRVEKTPPLVHAKLFADVSCDTPLKEGHISTLRTDCPGLGPNEPMAIVIESPSISDGKYVIKNRAEDIYWNAYYNPIIRTVYYFGERAKNNHMQSVYFWPKPTNISLEQAKKYYNTQVNKHSLIIQVVIE